MLLATRARIANILAGGMVIAVALATLSYGWLAIERTAHKGALSHAERWVKAAFTHTNAIEHFLSGHIISVAEDHRIGLAARASKVVAYDVFQPDGALRRHYPGSFRNGDVSLDAAQDIAAEVARTREAVVVQTNAERAGKTAARVFLPIIRHGRVIAVMSPLVDNSAEFGHARDSFIAMFIAVILLAGTAFVGTFTVAVLLRQQKYADARLRHMASHDALTGLANRASFSAAIHEAMPTDGTPSDPIALMFIDIDRFKSINDVLGHAAGDTLLREVSAILQRGARPADLVARLGGDEFAIIQRTGDVADATRLARQLNAEVRTVDRIGTTPVTLSISIGIALSPAAGDPMALQHIADAALYATKDAGRDGFTVYKPGMEKAMERRDWIRSLIRNALTEDAFEVHYQPVHDTRSGELTSFEALLRLPDGGGEYVSPTEFIPVAEDIGVACEIGERVMMAACAAATKWPTSVNVSVNLSPMQFRDDVFDLVERALAASGLSATRLELEITENAFVDDPHTVDTQLRKIRALGVQVVMDDFGAGRSSLRYLWQFPFDKLKVDRSCFVSVGQSECAEDALRTISAMSLAMQIRVTAEGIETQSQHDIAQEAGCNEVQGFLYHHPMPGDEVSAYIDRARKQPPGIAGAPAGCPRRAAAAASTL